MTAPSMIKAMSLETPWATRVFSSSRRVTAPIRVPTTVIRPPVSGTPATATAAMADSSMPSPMLLASEEELTPTTMRPTSAARIPEVTYTSSFVRATGTPASRAEFSLPPTAMT